MSSTTESFTNILSTSHPKASRHRVRRWRVFFTSATNSLSLQVPVAKRRRLESDNSDDDEVLLVSRATTTTSCTDDDTASVVTEKEVLTAVRKFQSEMEKCAEEIDAHLARQFGKDPLQLPLGHTKSLRQEVEACTRASLAKPESYDATTSIGEGPERLVSLYHWLLDQGRFSSKDSDMTDAERSAHMQQKWRNVRVLEEEIVYSPPGLIIR